MRDKDGKEESRKVGRLLREQVYEVPVDRKVPSKEGHVAPLRKGKSVILAVCDWNNESSLRCPPDMLSRRR